MDKAIDIDTNKCECTFITFKKERDHIFLAALKNKKVQLFRERKSAIICLALCVPEIEIMGQMHLDLVIWTIL